MSERSRKHRKAANGSGSVRYDRARRRWIVAVTLGLDDSGRQRRLRKSFATEDEARSWLGAKRVELARLRNLGVDPLRLPELDTVGDFLGWWITEALPGTVAPLTEQNYRQIVARMVVPHVGHLRLAELQPAHVTAMVNALAGAGYSANSQRLARAVLRRALKRAEIEGLVLRNAAALADGVRLGNREGRTLTPLEARRLMVELGRDRLLRAPRLGDLRRHRVPRHRGRGRRPPRGRHRALRAAAAAGVVSDLMVAAVLVGALAATVAVDLLYHRDQRRHDHDAANRRIVDELRRGQSLAGKNWADHE